ncbi:MAG: hypothetical protein ACI4NC_06290 [Succinivibrio sp.]
MELATIKALRERCPSFKNRVFGSLEFRNLDAIRSKDLPCAYVFTIADSPKTEQRTENYYYQEMTETVGIAVLVSAKDSLGLGAVEQFKKLREEIYKAVLGWAPLGDPNCYYSLSDRRLLQSNSPSYAIEQIELQCDYAIGYENTYKPIGLNNEITEIHSIHGKIDVINDRTKAPDGRIESEFEVKDLW